MPVKLKWPWLGIAIPASLIAFIAYPAHYFILSNFFTKTQQIFYECLVCMIWLSYYLAITTNPGKPSDNPSASSQQESNTEITKLRGHKFCKKCNYFKPARTHHCKTCNQCVLMMDHHCPWTMNCVGYKNYLHFMRFLLWLILSQSYLIYHLVGRGWFIWKHRYSTLPQLAITRSELVSLIILTPLDSFLLLTIVVLFIRCFINQVVNGTTQIEAWEKERLESLFYSRRSNLLGQLIENVWLLFPQEHTEARIREAEDLLRRKQTGRLQFEEVVNFPYNTGLWSNFVQVFGSSPLMWIWPWGGPGGDGVNFKVNDLSQYEQGAQFGDTLLCLPWPPDAGKQSPMDVSTEVESIRENGEYIVRNRNTPTRREVWTSVWGENLQGFGVDVDAE